MSSTSPLPPRNPIHLVLGDSGTGCVREASATFAMPGEVVGFSGDLAYGSLDEHCCALFSQWRALIARLDQRPTDAVIIWNGKNVADAIFMAMACDQLAERAEPLLSVQVPEIDMRPYVAMHSPAQIARLYATHRRLNTAHRLLLAQDFARIHDTCGPVRRLEQGRVVGVPIDRYDPLLLWACGADWQAAGHVVGTAMAHCDGPNLLGDAFFSVRLDFLVDAGRIEARGTRTAMRDYSVRLATH